MLEKQLAYVGNEASQDRGAAELVPTLNQRLSNSILTTILFLISYSILTTFLFLMATRGFGVLGFWGLKLGFEIRV